jgi:hypothetical protein
MTIEGEFRRHLPVTVAEPAARIEALTGLTRNPMQVRQALNVLGMRPCRVGSHTPSSGMPWSGLRLILTR